MSSEYGAIEIITELLQTDMEHTEPCSKQNADLISTQNAAQISRQNAAQISTQNADLIPKKQIEQLLSDTLSRQKNEECISLIYKSWLKSRSPTILQAVLAIDWIPESPGQLRVLVSLKKGLGCKTEFTAQEVSALIQATKDSDQQISAQAKAAIVFLKNQDTQEEVFKHFFGDNREEIEILEKLALSIPYRPQKLRDQVLFCFLIHDWKTYAELDPSSELLQDIYQDANPQSKERISEALRHSARFEWIADVITARKKYKLSNMCDLDWQLLQKSLSSSSNWSDLWKLCSIMPAANARQILLRLSQMDWRPENPEEVQRFERLLKYAKRLSGSQPAVTRDIELWKVIDLGSAFSVWLSKGSAAWQNRFAFAHDGSEFIMLDNQDRLLSWSLPSCLPSHLLIDGLPNACSEGEASVSGLQAASSLQSASVSQAASSLQAASIFSDKRSPSAAQSTPVESGESYTSSPAAFSGSLAACNLTAISASPKSPCMLIGDKFGRIHLLDLSRRCLLGKHLDSTEGFGSVSELRLSPSGNYLNAIYKTKNGSKTKNRLWHTKDWTDSRIRIPPDSWISPDDKWVLYQEFGQLHLSSLQKSPQLMGSYPLSRLKAGLEFFNDSTAAIVINGGTLQVHEVPGLRLIAESICCGHSYLQLNTSSQNRIIYLAPNYSWTFLDPLNPGFAKALPSARQSLMEAGVDLSSVTDFSSTPQSFAIFKVMQNIDCQYLAIVHACGKISLWVSKLFKDAQQPVALFSRSHLESLSKQLAEDDELESTERNWLKFILELSGSHDHYAIGLAQEAAVLSFERYDIEIA